MYVCACVRARSYLCGECFGVWCLCASICPPKESSESRPAWLRGRWDPSQGASTEEPTAGPPVPTQPNVCSYVLTKKKRNYISFFPEQEIRVEDAWWTMHGWMGTRTQGMGHQSLRDHIVALCPWHPYQPHRAGLPHPGSKVWVQSLLPGLGQPGHRDPSAFGLKRGLSPHSTPYRSSATSPPPCAFILGARVSAPVGLRGVGCQAWPCATTWVPKVGLSFSCCQCDPWAGPSYPGLRRFPGSPEVLAGRNLWAEPSCLKPECHLRQGCVSLSVMWAECQQGRGEVSCTALGTVSGNRCSLSLGSLLETAAPWGPALPWRDPERWLSQPLPRPQSLLDPARTEPGGPW